MSPFGSLASTNAAILSNNFMENGGDLSTKEMGSGPYMMKKWDRYK
jgi:ABC-type oligopeptide transport system substrate-binding subunit